MRSFLAAMVVLAAGLQPAGAGNYQDIDGTWWTTIDPPPHYHSTPVKIEVRYLSRQRAQDACELSTGKSGQFGCANLWPTKSCFVTVVDDLPLALRNAVLQHELAHCHGWPADHPEE